MGDYRSTSAFKLSFKLWIFCGPLVRMFPRLNLDLDSPDSVPFFEPGSALIVGIRVGIRCVLISKVQCRIFHSILA